MDVENHSEIQKSELYNQPLMDRQMDNIWVSPFLLEIKKHAKHYTMVVCCSVTHHTLYSCFILFCMDLMEITWALPLPSLYLLMCRIRLKEKMCSFHITAVLFVCLFFVEVRWFFCLLMTSSGSRTFTDLFFYFPSTSLLLSTNSLHAAPLFITAPSRQISAPLRIKRRRDWTDRTSPVPF